VCGVDRVTCYPGADDVTGEPRLHSVGEWGAVTWGFYKYSLFNFHVI